MIVRGNVFVVRVISLTLAALLAGVSLIGLLSPGTTYHTQKLFETFIPNDVINLLIVLPVLLISLWFAFRGTLFGLLLWPGALFYVFYTFLVYIFSIPLNVIYVGYLVGLGILCQATMLMIGLLVYIGLSPFVTDQPIDLTDFVVVLALSLIFVIPFILFLRGVIVTQNRIIDKNNPSLDH